MLKEIKIISDMKIKCMKYLDNIKEDISNYDKKILKIDFSLPINKIHLKRSEGPAIVPVW